MFTHLFDDALTSSVSAVIGVALATAGVYLARRRPDLRNWIAGTAQIVLSLMLVFVAYSSVSDFVGLRFFGLLALFAAAGYGGLVLHWWSGDGRVIAGASVILSLQSLVFILHPMLW